jgi:anion-transporting  ArsA/GET3 family ATPase
MLTTVEPLLDGRRMVICAGSGGVGKTTTAAAVALGLAERGKRVAVVTIDPARRLANALGLDELDNEPRKVELEFEGGGELWAMMLDAKRTFDQLIEHLAPDERTRDEVFANRIYQQLSSAVAGSQEFTAIAKLYELDRDGDYDVLVLDTPPSRNALDFLDAPGRLTGFFQGRAIRVFMRPAGLSGRILGRGTGMVFGILQRVTGVDLLRDLSVFFRSLGGMIDGFTERAKRVGDLLEDPATTFLIVTAPRHDPVEEAIFFHRKLREAGMPFGGLVINRVHQPPDEALPAAVAADLGPALAERVSVATGELAALAARDAANVRRLRDRLGDPPTILVPELAEDVHDVDGLELVRSHLFE